MYDIISLQGKWPGGDNIDTYQVMTLILAAMMFIITLLTFVLNLIKALDKKK
ncbi:hypothetical protein D3C81_1780280 [compost metagenome]